MPSGCGVARKAAKWYPHQLEDSLAHHEYMEQASLLMGDTIKAEYHRATPTAPSPENPPSFERTNETRLQSHQSMKFAVDRPRRRNGHETASHVGQAP